MCSQCAQCKNAPISLFSGNSKPGKGFSFRGSFNLLMMGWSLDKLRLSGKGAT